MSRHHDARIADRFAAHYVDVADSLFAWARLRLTPALGRLIDAEDLAQEVSYRALRGFGAFDPTRGPFRPWLFGVAHIVLADLLRHAARSAPPAATDVDAPPRPLDSLPLQVTSITTRAARDEELKLFLDHVEQLPDDDRELVVLRGLEGLSLAETAQVMGIGEEAATKRWQRLRAKMREAGRLHRMVEDG